MVGLYPINGYNAQAISWVQLASLIIWLSYVSLLSPGIKVQFLHHEWWGKGGFKQAISGRITEMIPQPAPTNIHLQILKTLFILIYSGVENLEGIQLGLIHCQWTLAWMEEW